MYIKLDSAQMLPYVFSMPKKVMLIINPVTEKSFFFPILVSGSMFLPPTTVAGATLYSVAIYGGLVLFSMFLLYDTQKVIKRAEVVPMYGVQKYDPINS